MNTSTAEPVSTPSGDWREEFEELMMREADRLIHEARHTAPPDFGRTGSYISS